MQARSQLIRVRSDTIRNARIEIVVKYQSYMVSKLITCLWERIVHNARTYTVETMPAIRAVFK